MLDLNLIEEILFYNKPHLLEISNIDSVLEWDDVNKLLGSGLLDYPRIRVANSDNEYSKNYDGFIRYNFSDRGEKQAWVVPGVIYKNLRDGCTVIIDRCETYFPKVKEIVEKVESSLSCQAWANLYISPRGCSGFKCHFDDHDVLAIQVHGRKLWKIYEPTHSSPNRGDKSFYLQPPHGKAYAQEQLNSGKVIYVPYGYWHAVETLSPLSLHISIGLDFPRRLDMIGLIRMELAKDKYFRDRLACSTSSKDFKQRCIEAIDNMDIDEMIHRLQQKNIGRRGFDIYGTLGGEE
ncbi:JmjC domain-containing protein [Halomonas caseinilytica]|uniref:JmjC domain-containing protein n=1 Tax=Halomonas caseinilytica TaxID=438744 RepID=UPI0009F4B035|nr:cupin domain-containing protein [Halomonas caseinilytica]